MTPLDDTTVATAINALIAHMDGLGLKDDYERLMVLLGAASAIVKMHDGEFAEFLPLAINSWSRTHVARQ